MVPSDTGEVGFQDGDNEESGLVDLSGVDENGKFEVIPRGTYNAEVANVEYGISQGKGNKMWTWQLELTDEPYQGRKLFYHTTFNEGGLPRVKKALIRLGKTDLLQTAFDPVKVADEGILIGLKCKVRVDVKPYEGSPRNNVKDLLPAGEGGQDFLST